MHPEEKRRWEPQIRKIIRERQASAYNMVDIATLEPLFAAEGLRYADFGFASLRDFLNEFRTVLNLVDGAPAGGGLPAKSYVQLKDFETSEATVEQKAEVSEQPLRPVLPEGFAQPELSAEAKAALAPKIQAAFRSAASNEGGWVNLASLGALLKENGADAKQFGFQKIFQFLEQFPELLAVKREPTPSGKAWVVYAKLRDAASAPSSEGAGHTPVQHAVRADAVHAATEPSVPPAGTRTAKAASGSEEALQAELSAEEKVALGPKVCAAVQGAASDEAGWVNLAGIGEALKGNGIDVKLLGFQKILPFLEQFPELIALKREPTPSGRPGLSMRGSRRMTEERAPERPRERQSGRSRLMFLCRRTESWRGNSRPGIPGSLTGPEFRMQKSKSSRTRRWRKSGITARRMPPRPRITRF